MSKPDLDEGGQSLKTEKVSNNDMTKSFFEFEKKKKNTSKVGSQELRAFIESSGEKVSMLRALRLENVKKIVHQVQYYYAKQRLV